MITVDLPATVIATNVATVAVPGTQVQLPDTPSRAVRLRALDANTGLIYFGDSTVAAATGDRLAATESIDLGVDNLNRIWIDAAVAGEGVSWTVLR